MIGSHLLPRLRLAWRAPITIFVVSLLVFGSFGWRVTGQSPPPIELVSATTIGVPAGGQLFLDALPYDAGGQAHISGDNRYVVFASPSAAIVPGDTNGLQDLFLRDRQSTTTTLVSRAADLGLANDHSNAPVISTNGRYVAFVSLATNLVAGDSNGVGDVFVRDLQNNVTTRVSVSSLGVEGNALSYGPSISADGRYVAFVSTANNLVAGDTNVFNSDVFVRDTVLGTTERVSLLPDGSEILRTDALYPSISADGRRVAFGVYDNVLAGPPPVSAGPNLHHGIYVRDLNANTTTLVSARPDGTPAELHYALYPMISANGRYVVFTHWEDLDPNFPDELDENDGPYEDVFVRDLQTSVTDRVSLRFPGGPAEESGGRPTISGNGRYVAYLSRTGNVRVRDRVGSTTTVVGLTGVTPDGDMDSPAISNDGQLVYFESYATNLVPNDTNAAIDTFVFRMAPSADLSLTLTASTLQPAVGSNVTFTVGVTNAGPNEATGVTARALLPAGMTYVSDDGSGAYAVATGAWSVGTLAPGSTSTLQIVAQFTATSSVSLTAQVTASSLPDPDSTPDNGVSTEDDQRTIVLIPGIADLSLTLATNTTTPTVNSNVTLTAALMNGGPATGTGIGVRVALPASLTFVSATPGAGSYNSGTGTWTLPSLPNGTTRTLQVVARVTNATVVDVVAQVSAANETDPDSTPNNSNASEDDQASVRLTPVVVSGIIVNDATPVVNPTDGKCTLIEAIIAANTDAPSGNALGECSGGSGADVIRLRALTPTYTFTTAHNAALGPTATPVITSDITIDGADAIIERRNDPVVPSFRLFAVATTGRLVLNHTNVHHGRAQTSGLGSYGGGIYNEGLLEIEFAAVAHNIAACDGGGIMSTGPLVLRGANIFNNSTGCSGGGVGTFYAGSVTISDTLIQVNSAPAASGGGLFMHGMTIATITGGAVVSNTARLEGGGVFLHGPDANLSVASTIISGNAVAAGSGGGIANGRLANNGTASVFGGNLQLSNVTVAGNRITDFYGAGISTASPMTIVASSITDNQATGFGFGGGLYTAAPVTIAGTTIARNQANDGSGGGICASSNGSLVVTNSTIVSNSSKGFGGGVALFQVPSVTFTKTTIGSNTGGGGIYFLALTPAQTLVLDNTLVEQNRSTYGGGGLTAVGGTVTVRNNTRVIGNVAVASGGGIVLYLTSAANTGTFAMTGGVIDGNTSNGDYVTYGGGGGLANHDTNPASSVTLTDVVVSSNHALGSGNGGGIFNRGVLTVTGGALRHNDAQAGGGLANGTSTLSGGWTRLNSVLVEDNVGPFGGGGIFVANPPGPPTSRVTVIGSTIRGNRANLGAGMYVQPNTTLEVSGVSLVSGNAATVSGGGVYSGGTLRLDTATVANNTSEFAGALHVFGPTTVVGSTISGNSATRVGGVHVEAGATTDVRSSTISGNRATSTTVDSGGAFDIRGTLNLASSTVVGNVGRSGGINSDGRVTIDNAILAGNVRPDGVFAECKTFPGAVWTQQFNIIGQDPNCILSATVTADPFNTSGSIDPSRVFIDLVRPLANNGGPTSTHALVPGSLAIDAGNFVCPATDQRGQPRPADGDGDVGARCDIGAVEQQTPLQGPVATLVSLTPASALAGAGALTLTMTGTGFAAGSTVMWNGAPRPTYVATPTRLSVVLPASDLVSTEDLKTVAVTIVNPGAGPSNALAFTIVSTKVLKVQSQIAPPGGSATATALGNVLAQQSISATLTNNGTASPPATISVATYVGNPINGLFAAGGFFDVQVKNADATDSAAVRFYYPGTVTGAVETALQLQYWNGTAWVPVIGSSGAAPVKNTTNNLDGTLSGGLFTVTLDATSTPRLMDLSGTVFALVEATAGLPVTVATESPAANAAGWHNTSVVVTLKATAGGSTIARTEYNLDDRGWTRYSLPIQVLTSAIHTLRYRSITSSGTVENAQTLTVRIDKTAPTLRLQVEPLILWPADGRLRNVEVDATLKDSLSGGDRFTLISVDSNHANDAADIAGWTVGTADTRGQLRAKFTGLFNPRIYRLTYKGTDRAGNETIECVYVLVLQLFGLP